MKPISGIVLKIIVPLMLAALVGCGTKEKSFVQAFRGLVESAQHDQRVVVKVSSVTDFSWDKLFIFGPYTPSDKIDRQLGYIWSSKAKDRIAFTQGVSLMVFVQDGIVVRYFEYPRQYGDFELPPTMNTFLRGDDNFKIGADRTTTNWPVLLPLKGVTD